MNWSEHVFQYCERGHSALFWAEPLNAISNGAFILAGIAAAVCLVRSRPNIGEQRFAVTLIVLLFAIGAGSFLFHTFADRRTELADQGPITLFVFGYLVFALRTFLSLRWMATAAIMIAFVAVSVWASSVTCSLPDPDMPADIGDSTCLWGSVAYLPALVALWTIGAILHRRSHVATASILAASAVFSLSLAVRTVDIPACQLTAVLGKPIGTHFLWHILNACTLFILLRAAIRYRR
jgi:hypothetical protein